MLRNHIFIAFRNFKKRKSFTFINILGLTVGMTVCLLILTYARYELSFDRYHENADEIYRVSVDIYNGKDFQIADAQCYPAVGPMAVETFPEIENYAMARHIGRMLVKREQTAFNEDRVYFASQNWFDVFDAKLIQGSLEKALSEPDKIVLTETAARKYFGDENPVGKVLTVVPGGGQVDMMITAVVADVPENSHLSYDILISWETGVKYLEWKHNEWDGNNEFMYLLANMPLDNAFKGKINSVYYGKTKEFDIRGDSLTIQPLTDIHLNSDKSYEAQVNGSEQVVNILLIISAFVLIIAWVNYINLSTARALERAKEVGVKKVMGSGRSVLMTQFLLESLILNLLAIILTVTLIQGVLPWFNNLAGVTLSFNIISEPQLQWQLLGILVLGTLASGLYPAFVLSGHKPLAVISGKMKDSKSGVLLRKGLVIFQFAVTMLLLIGTITIYQQITHMRNQDLGVNMDRTVAIYSPILPDSDEEIDTKRKTFETQLMSLSTVDQVTISESTFGSGSNFMNTTTGMKAVESGIGGNINYAFFRIDDKFLQTFQIDLLAGRYFDDKLETPFEDGHPTSQGMIVNETARKALGFSTNEEAIGKKINRWGRIFTLIGVVDDYYHNSVKYKVEPMAFFHQKGGSSANFISIKLKGSDNNKNEYAGVLKDIEAIYRGIFPASDFDYFFVDENFNMQYRADQQFGTVFTAFSVITIFVAVLGLFGLVLYEVQQRIKEIGIRKVLGASVLAIVKLFSSNFLKLIAASIIISTPVAYWAMNQWLSGYADRIGINIWLFILPALIILAIALITIFIQAIRAANRNPVEALRYE